MALIPKNKIIREFEDARADWVIPAVRLGDDALLQRAHRLTDLLAAINDQREIDDAFFRFHGRRWRRLGDTLIIVTAVGAVIAVLPATATAGAIVSAVAATGQCGLHFWRKSREGRHQEVTNTFIDMIEEVTAELDAVNEAIRRRNVRPSLPKPPRQP